LLTGGMRNQALHQANGPIVGILTDAAFRVVIKALEQRSGTDLLTAPRVTTWSGRQTQIKVVDIQPYVAFLDTAQTAGGGGATTPGTNTIEAGPIVDVLPHVLADGYTIQLEITANLKEFRGYDDPGPFVPQLQSTNRTGAAAPMITPTPVPRFRLRQSTTSVIVWDGQTVVIGRVVSAEAQIGKGKLLLGDLPPLGRSFRGESGSNTNKLFLIFVTPIIIDAAGNPVHTADQLPGGGNSIPPQRRRF